MRPLTLTQSDTSSDPVPSRSGDAERAAVAPRVRHAIFVLLAAMSGMSLLGSALAPYFLVEHPLLLVGLAPAGRHVVLAAPHVPLVSLLAIVTLRRAFGLIASYGLGYLYGDATVRFVERRYPRLGRLVRLIERLFARWGAGLVLLSPSHTLALLAGAGRMSFPRFVVAGTIGECAWIAATALFGELVSGMTDVIIAFLSRNLLAATVVSATIVIGYQAISRWRARREQAAKPPLDRA